jgi:hypothetical protein
MICASRVCGLDPGLRRTGELHAGAWAARVVFVRVGGRAILGGVGSDSRSGTRSATELCVSLRCNASCHLHAIP